MIRLLPAIALCLCTLQPIIAQIIINEVCASNLNGLLDSDGDREDWFELYNVGPTAVNISGWFMSDDPADLQKWVIPNGQSIAPGAYRTVFCSGKDKIVGAAMHTNFKISQTKGEWVILSLPDGSLADGYNFTIPNQVNHSYGRSPNGGFDWKIFTTPTPGTANTGTSYQAYAPYVQASIEAGFYSGSAAVSLSTDPGFTIRYTTNGSEPTAASTLYSGALNITATTVLKARAFSTDPQILPGFVTANTYFINVNHTIPVVSIAGNGVANLMSGQQSNPAGSFEYFENNVLETEAYGEFNKHGNDSWAYAQRGIDWITRDQMGYKDVVKHEFFPERDRKKFQRLILKAAANDNYPFSNGGAHIRDSYVHTLALHGGLDLDVRTHRSCVLYVNGQYWGVYDLREKVDDADFTKHYYDQDEFDMDYIKTWGATWAEYGSFANWTPLKNFILGNNMAVPANYDYVQQRFDLLSLIDYVIINQHTVCKDWLNWNTSWWRGYNPDGGATKWRYALWDMDATFGHYINYTGIPNIGPTADPCDVEQIPNSGDPQNHIDIFMALYANPQFKDLYINRYADLLNTSLSCEYMNALLDSMINTIAPEMPQQCSRWGGTMGQWNQNVNALRDFINSRCQVLDASIVDCYEVTGPFGLTVNVSPAGSPNQVMVNTITPTIYPYVGDYFGDVSIDLVAKPAPGWQFDHWEVSGNSFGPNQFADAIDLAFQTTGVVTAYFIIEGPCTPPTDVVVSGPTVTPALDWTDQPAASSYLIQYRKVGDPVWTDAATTGNTWDFDALPGCTDYEGQIQSVCPQGSSDFVDFEFATPDLLPDFELSDAVICNTGTALLDATVPGATYLWDDGSSAPTLSVTNPGNFGVVVQMDGCTATDTAQVTQVIATATLQPVLCPGEIFSLGGETFDELQPNGQVIFPNMATSGCDSIVEVSLQFLASSETQLIQTSCDPAAVGVDTLLLTNAVGCDSLVITTTILVPTSETFLAAVSCNPNSIGIDTVFLTNTFGCDSLVITTTSFDGSGISVTPLFAQSCDPAAVGVDTILLTNVAGCDSLVITTTTLLPSSETYLAAVSCNPQLLGTDTLWLTNVFGCDSLVITTTSFDPGGISITPLFAQNCDPAAVGVDTVLLANMAGCDSLVITTTTLASFSQTNLSALSCNPSSVGIDTVWLTSAAGCDSLVITTTSFDPGGISITPLFVQNCDPAAVGVDTVLLTNLAGCDSLVITTTTLAPSNQTLLTALSCNPGTVGTDTLWLANQFGCDSLVITTTTFDPSGISITPLFEKNCDPAAVGVDTVLLTNMAGCDSLVITTTALAIFSQTNLTALSCNPAAVGVDTILLTNAAGCDSLVITTTSFDPAAISVTPLFVQNCDPAAVGIDTVLLVNSAGCDSLVVTTTTLAPLSQAFLTALSCDQAAVGIDTLLLANQFGCDSLVITTVTYAGLDFEASAHDELCFGEEDGLIRLDTVITAFLPVELVLENHTAQFYTGTPLQWDGLPGGIYQLSATNPEGCTLAQELEVAEADELSLAFDQRHIVLHTGDSIWVEPVANFQIATAEWSPSIGVNCPTCPGTFLSAPGTANYTLTATDANGCTASASLMVQVDRRVRIFVPNALRPGSGGPNEHLTIFAGPEVAEISSLQLFDRWGNQLFEQQNFLPNVPVAWDGTFRGKLVPQGVIVWMLTATTTDGEKVKLSGDITVLR
ncbi:MAG: CotH kinase family protein [Saprospiraceae bacterium]|nr:CotH kinase family protein [Saprospiraceae bacterium]